MDWLRAHRNDLLLAAALAAAAGILALFLLLTRQTGARVRVSIGGETVMEVPLSEDGSYLLGEPGHTNLLVIRNGGARVAEADCPDLLCVHQGEIRWAGQSIICLPHALVITVEKGPDGGFDAVA